MVEPPPRLTAAGGLGQEGVDGGLQVEARVVPEGVVLRGRGDVEHERAGCPRSRSTLRRSFQNWASSTLPLRSIDAGRLREVEVAEGLHIRQALIQRGDGDGSRTAGRDDARRRRC